MIGHGHRFVRVAVEHTVGVQAFGSRTPCGKGLG